ncbi:SURF1 family protein [Vibrio wakamikoensis]|uniref:SURF1 family protein n=1 Tax=Vibrio TaxID=662 RepID=UPI003AB71CEB
MDTPHVRFYQTTKFWLGLVLTVVVFSSLVKLGLWQKQRGNEKVALEQSLALRNEQPPVALSSLDLPLAHYGDHNYQRWIAMPVSAHLIPEPVLFFLDNQILDGTVGYLVLQMMRDIEKTNQRYLVELGFVAGGLDRQTLPSVSTLSEPVTLSGRLYKKMESPLGSELYNERFDLESTQQYRIQHLNTAQISALVDAELSAWVVQPTDTLTAYPHPWKPVSMNSAKHFGYSFQWFTMATVFAVVVSMAFWRSSLHRNRASKGKRKLASKRNLSSKHK